MADAAEGPAAIPDRPALPLRQGIKKVIVEASFGDGMFTKLLTPIMLGQS